MSTIESSTIQPSPPKEPEFMDFLRGCGYETKGPLKDSLDKSSLVWNIFSNSIYLGNVIYDPNNQFCNEGVIAVNYMVEKITKDNGDTNISINPNQLTAAFGFERFLRQQNLPYTRGRPAWPIGEIVKFFKQETRRLEEIAKDLEQNPPPR